MFEEMRQEIRRIKDRNARVEEEKAWETSKLRFLCAAILSYFVIILLMRAAGIEKPQVAALAPATGFVLSMLSMQFAKKLWSKHFYKR